MSCSSRVPVYDMMFRYNFEKPLEQTDGTVGDCGFRILQKLDR